MSNSETKSIYYIFMLGESDAKGQEWSLLIIYINFFVLRPQVFMASTWDPNMWLPLKSVRERREKKNSYGVWKAACVCLGLKNTLAYSPALQVGRREHCLTCSFVSRCRSGSGRTARKPGVRPSLSAPPAGRTASGWSAGKRTRSPTSARQSESRSPASKKGTNENKNIKENTKLAKFYTNKKKMCPCCVWFPALL